MSAAGLSSGRLLGMAQGPLSSARSDTFAQLGGYDEAIFMGEDVDFYWRMTRAARKADCGVTFISDVQVVPSPRRFDSWPLWKTLFWTNPVVTALLMRHKSAWRGWYETLPR